MFCSVIKVRNSRVNKKLLILFILDLKDLSADFGWAEIAGSVFILARFY